jgi:ribosomal protein S18 acetylase RimI-like enzyme
LDGDEEIGTIWFERKGPDNTSYDLGVYLNRADLFGKGIGKTVIRSAMESIAAQKGIQTLCLNVRKGNLRAIHCYESLGFQTIFEGEKSNPSGDIGFYRMRVSLKRYDHS